MTITKEDVADLLLIAAVTATSAFWTHYTVIPTPDGPAVIAVEEGQP